jgi:hypothetical protein
VTQGLDAVRQVMTRCDHLLGADAPTMPPLPELHAQVTALHQDYQGEIPGGERLPSPGRSVASCSAPDSGREDLGDLIPSPANAH